MQLGDYKINPIECGTLGLDGGAMFGVIPKTIWEKTNPADDRNRITLAMRAMLIQGKGMNLLVECGAGDKFNDKLKGIYSIDYSQSSLESSLSKAGLNREDITHVVLTHLHFDHTGGATRLNGEGVLSATFPNATYFIHQTQWDTAFNPTPRDKASYFHENYELLKTNGQLELVQNEGELFAEIETIVVNGHTPGQMLIKISGGERVLLYIADLVPTSSHLPVPFLMSYDLEPLKTMEEKERVLSQAVEENWILFYGHDPFIVATEVINSDKGFIAGEEVNI